MPVPPYAHHLNLTMQTVATVLLWTATLATLAWAGVLARRDRTAFPVLLVLAVAAGSVLEPVYDILYHLLWYTGGTVHGDLTGHQWTLFTAFGLPQPVWVMPAYVMVFGLPALLMHRTLAQGATMARVFRMAALLFCTTAAFEITANNIDLYGYYGPAPLRLLKYPLWIAAMESAQITGFAVLCAVLSRRRTRELHGLALFALFPANFGFDVLGAGFPTLIAMNVAKPSTTVMTLTALLSVAFAATSLWWTAQLLLHDQRADAVAVPAQQGRVPVPA
ncbi:MAG: hypothetical protein ACXVEC_04835 [Nocardioides sp.]